MNILRPAIGVLILFVAGCTTKTEPPSKVPEGRSVDVWLIPMDGMPADHVGYVQERLERETGLTVRATVEAGKSPAMFDPASKQLISERVLGAYRDMPRRLEATSSKTVYIVLTTDDLNQDDRKLRFVFMTTAPAQRMAVLSIARMKETFYGAPSVPIRTKARMYKMAKKAVGILYFGYDRSSDRKSVMYSPIMGLDDLDAIGTDYAPGK